MQIFNERVGSQIEQARAENEKFPFDMTPFTKDDCIPDRRDESVVGKVVVMNAAPLRHEHQHSAYQLVLADGGNGANGGRGQAVFGTRLSDGHRSRWERYDVLGEIKPECMPDWAKESLAKIKQQEKRAIVGRNDDMEIRPMTQAERKYSYTQSMQLQGQTGNIGYLRGDFDSSGYGFFTTWNDHATRLKTDDFKAEFDDVINALRSDEYGLLKNRPAMSEYARKYPDSAFQGNYCTEFFFRADTEKHAYLIRCNPNKGDYNFYCYCYVSEWLDRHMQNAEKGIRFIDSKYNEKFRIPDGGKIIITAAWGEKNEYVCRYIDEAHLEIGNNLYHICEFAERMEKNGAFYEPKQAEPQPVKAPKTKEYER